MLVECRGTVQWWRMVCAAVPVWPPSRRQHQEQRSSWSDGSALLRVAAVYRSGARARAGGLPVGWRVFVRDAAVKKCDGA